MKRCNFSRIAWFGQNSAKSEVRSKSEVVSAKCEVRRVRRSIPGFPKHETAYSTDFALRTDDFGLATAHSTDFALRTDDFAL